MGLAYPDGETDIMALSERAGPGSIPGRGTDRLASMVKGTSSGCAKAVFLVGRWVKFLVCFVGWRHRARITETAFRAKDIFLVTFVIPAVAWFVAAGESGF